MRSVLKGPRSRIADPLLSQAQAALLVLQQLTPILVATGDAGEEMVSAAGRGIGYDTWKLITPRTPGTALAALDLFGVFRKNRRHGTVTGSCGLMRAGLDLMSWCDGRAGAQRSRLGFAALVD